jgi:DNA-binding NarL/FixJ family response regulator
MTRAVTHLPSLPRVAANPPPPSHHTTPASLVSADSQVRELVTAHLTGSREFRLGRVYTSAEEALLDMSRQPPDATLVDLRLPGIGGIECVHRLKRLFSRLPVIVLADQCTLPDFVRAFQAGADAYIVTPATRQPLEECLRSVLGGGRFFSREVQQLFIEHFTQRGLASAESGHLSRTEHEVMAHLIADLSDKEIAVATGHATTTIHSITSHIYKKLGVHTRTEAATVYLGFNRPATRQPQGATFPRHTFRRSTHQVPDPTG